MQRLGPRDEAGAHDLGMAVTMNSIHTHNLRLHRREITDC